MSEQEKRDNAAEKKEPASSEKKARDTGRNAARKPSRVQRWLKDLRGELKKVTWPSVKSVIKNVGVVIVCVLVVGVCIWVFDYLAHAVVGALLNLFS